MNATHNDNERLLDSSIEAMRAEGDADELREATARFRARLPRPTPARRTRVLRWAGAGLAAALLITVGPQLLPGHQGTAFAAVQAWFKNFRTVHMQTVTTQGKREISRMNIWATASGKMRLEVGPVVNIVNPDEGAMHTLLPGKQVMNVPITSDSDHEKAGAMKWIRDIRAFQGKAMALPQTRTIAGEVATGYQLTLDGTTVELWAARRSNRPLLMEVHLGGGALMRTRFEFDTTPPNDAFSVPPGYRAVQPED